MRFFLFCLKMCEYEKLKALFLKLHHEFCKTQELRFSRSVSKDDGGKVGRCLHSQVKWLYSAIKSIVL